jgi:nicotinamidase-related amidase
MGNANGVWTSEKVALVLIDYQKEMFENVKSETTPDEIDLNVRFLIKTAKAFNIPLILSTVGVEMGVNGQTRGSIRDELPDVKVIDRSSMNAWEDAAFQAAIENTGKKRLIFGTPRSVWHTLSSSRCALVTTPCSSLMRSAACHSSPTEPRSNV